MPTHLCFVLLECLTATGAGLRWTEDVQPHLAMTDHVPVVRALVVVLHSDATLCAQALPYDFQMEKMLTHLQRVHPELHKALVQMLQKRVLA